MGISRRVRGPAAHRAAGREPPLASRGMQNSQRVLLAKPRTAAAHEEEVVRGDARGAHGNGARAVKASRIYLFRKKKKRFYSHLSGNGKMGWGNHASKRGWMPTSTSQPPLLKWFSEQLNATMRHLGTELVAFTLGSHLFY